MSIPHHLAIIPDGNRRWAKAQGLPAFEGHRRGYELFKEVGDWAFASGVKQISFWGFSTENWKRSEEEVGFLMSLLLQALTKDARAFHDRNIRVKVIGRKQDFSPALQEAIEVIEKETEANTAGQVNLCVNYGGRAELLHVVQTLLRSGKHDVTEEDISSALWTAGIPDPDLVIRTGGEQRLSGFQPWQTVYSEWVFEKMFWPDFSRADFDRILKEYDARDRRYGA